MMSRTKILSALLLTLSLGVTACSSFAGGTAPTGADSSRSESSRTALRESTTGSLEDEARKLGGRARSSAEDALGMAQGFFSGFSGQEVDGDSFRSTWESLKEKLQEMADNATTEEARRRIDGVIQDLEASFTENMAKIRTDESVQEIRASITEFWNEARTKISELLK